MSRFRFRLQRVLQLREDAERARAVALVTAQDQADDARQSRDQIAAIRAAGHARLSTESASGSTVGALRQMHMVLGALESQLHVADTSVMTADSVVRRAQDELRDAFQARHSLDTLREKQRTAHSEAERDADRTLMNEIALTRFQNAEHSLTDSEPLPNA
jgi:flagellar protein FliJ